MGMTEGKKCWAQGAEKEFAVGVCRFCSFGGRKCSAGVGGGGGGGQQFFEQVESPRVPLGIVALTPVMAAELRGGLRRLHND